MYRTKWLSALALATAFILPTPFLNAQPQGQAWSWGFGRNGQLGFGSQTNISHPQAIKNNSFVDIDAKRSFAAGITKEGKLFTWGKNRNGILGHLPPNLNILLPREVEFPNKIQQVSLGYQTMCVVTQGGQAFVWGLQSNKAGFRSITTTEPQKQQTKIAIAKVQLSNIATASCANDYVAFATKEGSVYVMGDKNNRGHKGKKTQLVQLPLEHITKLSSGINFTMALDNKGQVYVWGNNIYGQLGNGGLKSSAQPILVQALIKEKVVDISAGDSYSGVVTAKGEVYTWGFGNEGQLGHGDKSDQFAPRKIVNLQSKIKSISCGGAHTALLTQKGQLFMVGRGREGQLGREQKDQSSSGNTLLVRQVEQLPKGSRILKVSCGASHTLVLLDSLI